MLGRRRIARGNVDAADVRALHGERRRDAGLVDDLDEEQPRPSLHQRRPRRAGFHLDPAFRADVDGGEHVAIQDLLQAADRGAFVGQCNRLVQRGMIGCRQRLAEEPQPGLEPARLLRQRLQRDRRLGGWTWRALLRVQRQREPGDENTHLGDGGNAENWRHARRCIGAAAFRQLARLAGRFLHIHQAPDASPAFHA